MSQKVIVISPIYETIYYICIMETPTKRYKELNDLFLFVPPAQLRRSVTKVFFSFLTNPKGVASDTGLPHDFADIADDIWFLLNFLDQADTKEEE